MGSQEALCRQEQCSWQSAPYLPGGHAAGGHRGGSEGPAGTQSQVLSQLSASQLAQDHACRAGLPNSQDFPVHPSPQEQDPSVALHSPPFWQEQVCRQPSP